MKAVYETAARVLRFHATEHATGADGYASAQPQAVRCLVPLELKSRVENTQ